MLIDANFIDIEPAVLLGDEIMVERTVGAGRCHAQTRSRQQDCYRKYETPHIHDSLLIRWVRRIQYKTSPVKASPVKTSNPKTVWHRHLAGESPVVGPTLPGGPGSGGGQCGASLGHQRLSPSSG